MIVGRIRHGRRAGACLTLGMLLAGALPLAAIGAPTGRFSLDLQQNLRIDTGIPAVNGQRAIKVASVGDVNGDGRNDLAVSMPNANSNVGRAWVLFGLTPDALDSRIDSEVARRLDEVTAPGAGGGFRISASVPLGAMGTALTGGGDVNGDGRADVLVASTTTTFVVFGKSDDAPVAVNALGAGGFEIQNSGNGINLVTVLAGGSDVNGDGRADILIGDSVADRRGGGVNENSGSAWLVFGKATATPVDLLALGAAGYEIRGAGAGDTAGSSVAFTPDMTGDGRPEILVGAQNRDDDTGTTGREGAAYVIHGGNAPGVLVDLATINGDPTDAGFKISGPHQLGSFAPRMGGTVAGADVNGDGLGDAVVGATGWNPVPSITGGGRGAVFVVFGRSGAAPVANDQAATAGNIGATGYRIDGERESDFIGTNGLVTTPDVNGDGRAEIMFSANGPNQIGTTYLIYGKASTTTIDQNALLANGFALETPFNPSAPPLLGVTGIASTDVNNDGLTDFVVASASSDLDPVDADPLTIAGSIFVVYGRPETQVVDLAATVTGRIDGVAGLCAPDVPDRSAERMVAGGDVNGDGRSDLLIGAPEADTLGRQSNGAVYVVFGTPSLGGFDLCGLGPRGFRIDGAATADRITNSSANTIASGGLSAGDVNGDGLSDIIIGAKSIAGDSGRAYVVFGKATATNVDLATFPQADPAQGFRIDADPALVAQEELGSSVAGVGDLNGDGKSEVAIGAPAAETTTFGGRIYVIDGKTSGATVALPSGWTIVGGTNDSLGLEMTSIGDQNGDGRRELAFGKGARLVVFGRPGPAAIDAGSLAPADGYRINPLAGVSLTGPVVDVGNMVGDATSDLMLTGSINVFPNETPFAVILPGGSTAPTLTAHPSPGLRIDGVPGDGFATSGANVGDLNRDGLADLVIGIKGGKASGRVDGGAAYVVFGKPGSRPVDLRLLASEGVRYDGAATGDKLGTQVVALGDRTADGVADFAVSAPFTTPQAGTAYLIDGLTSDRVAPTTTIASGPSGTINTNTATVTFSSNEPGATFECSVDGGPFVACTSPFMVTGLANGPHTIQIRAVDPAGNRDATPATVTFTVVDTVKPVLSLVSLSRTTFAVVGVKSARKPAPKRGTVVRWTLSETARTTLRFERILPGRKRGAVCIVGRKIGKRCTAFRLVGSVNRNGVLGKNTFTFNGRLKSKALPPGKYRVVLTARDPSGNLSAKAIRTFTVIR